MYELRLEWVRNRILGEDAPEHVLMPSHELEALLAKMGLEVELGNKGAVVGAACRICGPVIGLSIGRHTAKVAQCDADQHKRFYDALQAKAGHQRGSRR